MAYGCDDNQSSSPAQSPHYAELAYDALERIKRIPGYDAETHVMNDSVFKKWFEDRRAN